MKLLPMLGVLGCLGLSTVLVRAQGPAVDPAAVTVAQPSVAQRPSRLPVFNLKTQGQWTIDQLVREVRAQVAKDKTGTQTVNIVMGPGVGELKAPADLELVNVTPMGVFAAIASVEPRLSFAPVSTPGSDLTIALQLRPDAREQGGAKDIKLRAFRLPIPAKDPLETNEEKRLLKQDRDMRMLHENLAQLLESAMDLRRTAGGAGSSKSFSFRVHRDTRTVLVTGTAEDLDLAQEVLTALGATPSSGRTEDPNAAKPARTF